GFMARARGKDGGRVPSWLGPTALVAVSVFFIGVVIWGWANPPEIRVEYLDAGRAAAFVFNDANALPERNPYVSGLEDGRLRAIDGRVEASGCTVDWLPNDARGRSYNPGSVSGVFEDPCSGATWSMIANAIQGSTEPLRTPYIDYRPGPDGEAIHAYV